MRTEIYTLDKENLDMLADVLPEYVIERSSLPGYFSIGAVSQIDGEDTLLGMAQFYINITPDGECFAEVNYVYVLEEFRRQGVGMKLIERINRILKKSDVKMSNVLIPSKDDELLGYELSGGDIESFFKECSYITTKEDICVWRSDLRSLLDKAGTKKANNAISKLEDAGDEDFSAIIENIIENADKSNPVPDDLKIEKAEYDGSHSTYYSQEDGQGALLVHRFGKTAIELALLRGYGKSQDLRLSELMVSSLRSCEEDFEDETLVLVRDRALQDEKLVDKIIPGMSVVKMKKFVRLTSR